MFSAFKYSVTHIFKAPPTLDIDKVRQQIIEAIDLMEYWNLAAQPEPKAEIFQLHAVRSTVFGKHMVRIGLSSVPAREAKKQVFIAITCSSAVKDFGQYRMIIYELYFALNFSIRPYTSNVHLDCPSKYKSMLHDMLLNSGGLEIKANQFVGSDLVDWVMKYTKKEREEAIQICTELFDEKIFYHMKGKKTFTDGKVFYHFRITADTVEQLQKIDKYLTAMEEVESGVRLEFKSLIDEHSHLAGLLVSYEHPANEKSNDKPKEGESIAYNLSALGSLASAYVKNAVENDARKSQEKKSTKRSKAAAKAVDSTDALSLKSECAQKKSKKTSKHKKPSDEEAGHTKHKPKKIKKHHKDSDGKASSGEGTRSAKKKKRESVREERLALFQKNHSSKKHRFIPSLLTSGSVQSLAAAAEEESVRSQLQRENDKLDELKSRFAQLLAVQEKALADKQKAEKVMQMLRLERNFTKLTSILGEGVLPVESERLFESAKEVKVADTPSEAPGEETKKPVGTQYVEFNDKEEGKPEQPKDILEKEAWIRQKLVERMANLGKGKEVAHTESPPLVSEGNSPATRVSLISKTTNDAVVEDNTLQKQLASSMNRSLGDSSDSEDWSSSSYDSDPDFEGPGDASTVHIITPLDYSVAETVEDKARLIFGDYEALLKKNFELGLKIGENNIRTRILQNYLSQEVKAQKLGSRIVGLPTVPPLAEVQKIPPQAGKDTHNTVAAPAVLPANLAEYVDTITPTTKTETPKEPVPKATVTPPPLKSMPSNLTEYIDAAVAPTVPKDKGVTASHSDSPLAPPPRINSINMISRSDSALAGYLSANVVKKPTVTRSDGAEDLEDSSGTSSSDQDGSSDTSDDQSDDDLVEEEEELEAYRPINYSDIAIEYPPIGSGAFGVVYKATWRGATVAVKQLLVPLNKKQFKEFVHEARIMERVSNHPNIAFFFGVTSNLRATSNHFCIVSEYYDNGAVADYLRKNPKTPWVDIVYMARGAAAGVLHLHKEHIIHRDLAARNLLLDAKLYVHVADFGLARTKRQAFAQTNGNLGSIKWLAPEAITNQYSESSDSYSFGVLLWELLMRGQEPYQDEEILSIALGVTKDKKRPPIPAECPTVWRDLMTACWEHEPKDRPTFEALWRVLDGYWKTLRQQDVDDTLRQSSRTTRTRKKAPAPTGGGSRAPRKPRPKGSRKKNE